MDGSPGSGGDIPAGEVVKEVADKEIPSPSRLGLGRGVAS
jgi:hypothetical protein